MFWTLSSFAIDHIRWPEYLPLNDYIVCRCKRHFTSDASAAVQQQGWYKIYPVQQLSSHLFKQPCYVARSYHQLCRARETEREGEIGQVKIVHTPSRIVLHVFRTRALDNLKYIKKSRICIHSLNSISIPSRCIYYLAQKQSLSSNTYDSLFYFPFFLSLFIIHILSHESIFYLTLEETWR